MVINFLFYMFINNTDLGFGLDIEVNEKNVLFLDNHFIVFFWVYLIILNFIETLANMFFSPLVCLKFIKMQFVT